MSDSTKVTLLRDLPQAQRDFLLHRGVAEIIPESEFISLLNSGTPARLKEGFDPSSPDIHLGHVVGLRKLRQLQELGHKVILIVGNWTARIGDPSGQSATRPMLTEEQIERNARTYMDQFFKVVDRDRTEVRWQAEWFSKFTLDTVIRLTARFTVAQILAREDFSKRYSSGSPISLCETLYPLLQAYDSYAIDSDVEFGGTDQKFNCLLGRELQQMMGQNPQQVFFTPILVGTDGKAKMSKSLGNYIGVAEPPEQMYGKVMSLEDGLILDYFELVTDMSDEELAETKRAFASGKANPMEEKKRLAREITAQFHGKEAARQADEHFTRVHQQHEMPEEMPDLLVDGTPEGDGTVRVELTRPLVSGGYVKSASEFKRLVAQNAVELDGNKVDELSVLVRDGSVVKIGRRTFVRIRVK
ncbi:MAG: tyrosine--tRNA ligase [Dehalococcoidia bacterium]|nr:tyrosine--tRNA ligase [Dehalococcoidia bacterium]